MISPIVAEYLRSDAYRKKRDRIFEILDKALDDLDSSEHKRRVKGSKRIRVYVYGPLRWTNYAVKEWFFLPENKKRIWRVLHEEKALKQTITLLHIQRFFYERFVTHPMWDNLRYGRDCEEYRKELGAMMASFVKHPHNWVRLESAYLLVMLGNRDGWDVFTASLKTRTCNCDIVAEALRRYAPESLSKEQGQALQAALMNARERITRPKIRAAAEDAIEMCEKNAGIFRSDYMPPSTKYKVAVL